MLRIRRSDPLLPHTLSGLHRGKSNFLLPFQQTTISPMKQPKLSSSGYRALREGTISEPWLREFENCRVDVHDGRAVRPRASGEDIKAA